MASSGFSWALPDHPKLPKGKTVAVVVLDGWGEANPDKYNCIHVAQTPVMDSLKNGAPERWRLVKAHGTAVGLPSDDDMGNSEVGHNALGVGRIFAQGLSKTRPRSCGLYAAASYQSSQKTPERFYENARNAEEEKAGRRLQWTEEDNIRLISAWLNNSVAPIDGNSKKGDIYWKQVATEYNKNSHVDRRRKIMNCKDHWGRMNSKIVQFNGIWCRLKHVYVSSRSDDQLMEKAHVVYKKETGQCFTLVYLWREVRNQPKWNRTYIEESKIKNNDTVMVQIEAKARPEGAKAAKAKAKAKAVADSSLGSLSHDDIQLYYKTLALQASKADKMAKVQLQLSKDKLEAAQAREREAITKSEKAIMDKYTELLMADTTCLTDFQRRKHRRALQYFHNKLIGGCNNN